MGTLYIPWRPVSGESFCSWNKVWNLPCHSSLTVENLPLHVNAVQDWITSIPVSPLNQCLSFSSSDFTSVILILLFQVIFPMHAGFHPFFQLRRQLKINLWIYSTAWAVCRSKKGFRTAFGSTSSNCLRCFWESRWFWTGLRWYQHLVIYWSWKESVQGESLHCAFPHERTTAVKLQLPTCLHPAFFTIYYSPNKCSAFLLSLKARSSLSWSTWIVSDTWNM